MRADFKVVLDACVLAPPTLCDLLLRLAETPRLYSPKWGREILDEVHRTQVDRLGFPREKADSWRKVVEQHFPEALVPGYEPLIGVVANDESDRHVVAVAIRAGAEVIVTCNLRHFPPQALEEWNIRARHPADFLTTLYAMEKGVVVSKLVAMAGDRGLTPEQILSRLGKVVPTFSKVVADDLGWEIDS